MQFKSLIRLKVYQARLLTSEIFLILAS